MINEIINSVEPTQAILPTWLIASLVINGGKLIAGAVSGSGGEISRTKRTEEEEALVASYRELMAKYKTIESTYIKAVNFKDIQSAWSGRVDRDYCHLYPEITDELARKIKSGFHTGWEEDIIFTHDNSLHKVYNQGVCITNQRIYIVRSNQDMLQRAVLNWAEISQVVYDNGVFYFIGQRKTYVPLPESFFKSFKDDVDCTKIAEFFSAIASATYSDLVECDTTTESQYSPQEQEYLDEFKECITENGEISECSRRLLSRIQNSLEISDERAAKLEASFTLSLTEDEEAYLEEYRSVIEECNGEITNMGRRLLNRFSKKLNISKERALEIEAM